ncbi:putative RNA methyltransferase CG1239 [Pseudolycoriella hygida]|uniref:RNA methyltransferase n=1 Tax=Pseudolycoriella hygida TaxID=35572 RepID=A0A9Q0MPB7_9DIPT|nr:putative RNA methyltransferase CG1239 [Pseudolycoriella hygida]
MCENSEHENSLNGKREELLESSKILKPSHKRSSTDRTFIGFDSDSKTPRLDVVPASIKSMNKSSPKNARFIHGNYDRYYGYRNAADFNDRRLDLFANHRTFFEGCSIMDVGCNNGLVTISVARDFNVKRIVGIDIDRHLVDKARKFLLNEKRNSEESGVSFPFNVDFKVGNYVLTNEKLLELEVEQFDTILCLSVTKWIHLNCGDDGLKLAFRRMFKQLLPGGRLILEAQDMKSYKRRKNLTPNIAANYKNIKFFPEMFDQYLLSSDIGFEKVFSIYTPKNDAKGFQRPIKVFVKGSSSIS